MERKEQRMNKDKTMKEYQEKFTFFFSVGSSKDDCWDFFSKKLDEAYEEGKKAQEEFLLREIKF